MSSRRRFLKTAGIGCAAFAPIAAASTVLAAYEPRRVNRGRAGSDSRQASAQS